MPQSEESTNEARQLTRDDYFLAKTYRHGDIDAAGYALTIATNRAACQTGDLNAGLTALNASLSTLNTKLTSINNNLTAINSNLASINERAIFLSDVVERLWEGYSEKGWFADLMRKIAER